jgi:hypothetical protein
MNGFGSRTHSGHYLFLARVSRTGFALGHRPVLWRYLAASLAGQDLAILSIKLGKLPAIIIERV